MPPVDVIISGIFCIGIAAFFLAMSYEKVGRFDQMTEKQLEEWRAKNKKILRTVSILLLIGGVLQVFGVIQIW